MTSAGEAASLKDDEQAEPREATPAKHFAIYIPTLEIGGAERVSVTLANGIAARGHRVTLLTVKDSGPFRANVREHVEVVALGGTGVIEAFPALVRWLKLEKPDAMLSMMAHTNLISIVARSVSKVKLRLIISERVSLAHALPDMKGRITRVLTSFLYKRADHITVVTKAMIAEIVKHTGVAEARVSAIYNPVIDDDFLRQSNEKTSELHPWFELSDRRVILAVGRLDVQKGFDTLLAAFSILASSDDSAYLIILGEGKHRAQLEALRKKLGLIQRVAFPGFATNPYPSMKRASLFVLSSMSEGLPGVLVQAMACGTQVVSTDCPTGPREILEDGKWGALVPVGDEVALAHAMKNALVSTDAPPNVESRAAFFNETNSVDRYLAILADEERR
jgi:glycosyltransferase involved in cell wall biosynthesis